MSHSASSSAIGSAGSDIATATNNSANGDKVALIVRVPGTASATLSSVPSGFSLLGTATNSGANYGRAETIIVYWKDETTAPGTYSVTVAGAGGTTPSLEIVSWSGRAAGAPSLVATSNANSSASPVNCPLTGYTASAGDDVAAVVGISSPATTGTWATTLTGYTSRQELSQNASGLGGTLATLTKDALSAGATGTLTAVSTNTGFGDAYGLIFSMAAAAGTAYDPITACFPIGYYE